MTYKLHVNGVITGSLNCFCLACDILFKSPQEASEHVGTSDHEKKAGIVQYSDKFKDEHIKKYKGGYYCEFCNILMPIASKVNLHITEEEHKHNKGILLLKSMGDDVVAFNNIIIEEKAWHGLIEGVCALCNAEFDDEDEHKTDASHNLNLVLKPIQFGANNAIFRHLDDTSVQCLTCNKLLAPSKMANHFDDSEHHGLYAKRRIETDGVCKEIETKENCKGIESKQNAQEKTTNTTSVVENGDEIKKSETDDDRNKNEKTTIKDKSKILESVAKYQSKGININLETETAFCKKCSQVITFDFTEIENHIENHSSTKAVDSDLVYPSNLDQNLNRVDINDKTTQPSVDKQNNVVVDDIVQALRDKVQDNSSNKEENDTDSSSSSSSITSNSNQCSNREARDLAKANKITYNGDNKQSYCRVCKVHLPATLRSMREHVNGANHKKLELLVQPKIPGKQAKESTREFVDSAYDVEGIFYHASIINEEFCILRNSFYFISENSSRIRCLVCEMNLPPYSDVEDHVKTRTHCIRWLTAPVIISEKKEFIREVRPGLYHCGYCNLVVPGWADMKQHLDCSDHRENRSVGENRMRFHYPNLQRFKMRKQLESMAMMSFFNMFD